MKELQFEQQKSIFSFVFQAQNRPFCRTFYLNQNQRENSHFPCLLFHAGTNLFA